MIFIQMPEAGCWRTAKNSAKMMSVLTASHRIVERQADSGQSFRRDFIRVSFSQARTTDRDHRRRSSMHECST
jgi:hypothetical protein